MAVNVAGKKVILVTGGNAGIGFAVCKHLLEKYNDTFVLKKKQIDERNCQNLNFINFTQNLLQNLVFSNFVFKLKVMKIHQHDHNSKFEINIFNFFFRNSKKIVLGSWVRVTLKEVRARRNS